MSRQGKLAARLTNKDFLAISRFRNLPQATFSECRRPLSMIDADGIVAIGKVAEKNGGKFRQPNVWAFNLAAHCAISRD